jgi:hypothetical protein
MPKRYEGSRLYLHTIYTMKKFFYVAVLALAFASCGKAEKEAEVTVATEIVPAAATEVIPAAAPGPDAGGKVATEVIPAEAATK